MPTHIEYRGHEQVQIPKASTQFSKKCINNTNPKMYAIQNSKAPFTLHKQEGI